MPATFRISTVTCGQAFIVRGNRSATFNFSGTVVADGVFTAGELAAVLAYFDPGPGRGPSSTVFRNTGAVILEPNVLSTDVNLVQRNWRAGAMGVDSLGVFRFDLTASLNPGPAVPHVTFLLNLGLVGGSIRSFPVILPVVDETTPGTPDPETPPTTPTTPGTGTGTSTTTNALGLTWLQAAYIGRQGYKIRRAIWSDRQLEYVRGFWFLQLFNAVTGVAAARAVVNGPDWKEEDFRATDFRTVAAVPTAVLDAARKITATYP